MEYVDGQWFMDGLDEDDPRRLRTIEELYDLVDEVGFFPLFKNGVEGYSVEERTVASDWWSEVPERDPWTWREIAARQGRVVYGKFFDKKAGFVSKKWFPVLANYRRDGYDFDARWEDQLASYRTKLIMDCFEQEKIWKSFELKAAAGFGKGGEKNFEGVLTELQMMGYLIMCDFQQKVNKKGEGYGWFLALYERPEDAFGAKFISKAYKDAPEKSLEKILRQIRKFYPEADEKELFKLIGKKK